jgi:hypothetical protein
MGICVSPFILILMGIFASPFISSKSRIHFPEFAALAGSDFNCHAGVDS